MSNLNKTMKQINKLIDKFVGSAQKDIAKKYANTLNEVRLELSKIYEKYEVNGILSYAEMAKYDRLTKFMKTINNLLDSHYKGLKNIIYKVLGNSYLEGFYLTAWAVETDTLNDLSFSVVAPEVILTMIENPISGLKLSDRLEKNRIDIVYKIQQEVTQGLVKGETYSKMANRLKATFEGDAVKSMRVVRTEGHRVQESAKLDVADHAQNNGVNMVKEWNSVTDERVRHAHSELNGKKIPVDDDFLSNAGGKGPAPGQMGVAADDINCRCFLTYSVDKITNPNVKELENMAFDTWKKERLSK